MNELPKLYRVQYIHEGGVAPAWNLTFKEAQEEAEAMGCTEYMLHHPACLLKRVKDGRGWRSIPVAPATEAWQERTT